MLRLRRVGIVQFESLSLEPVFLAVKCLLRFDDGYHRCVLYSYPYDCISQARLWQCNAIRLEERTARDSEQRVGLTIGTLPGQVPTLLLSDEPENAENERRRCLRKVLCKSQEVRGKVRTGLTWGVSMSLTFYHLSHRHYISNTAGFRLPLLFVAPITHSKPNFCYGRSQEPTMGGQCCTLISSAPSAHSGVTDASAFCDRKASFSPESAAHLKPFANSSDTNGWYAQRRLA